MENELFVLRNASREMRGGFLSHFDEKPAHVFWPKFAPKKTKTDMNNEQRVLFKNFEKRD